MSDIKAVNPAAAANTLPREESGRIQDKGFSDRLGHAIMTVNEQQKTADNAMEQVVKGTLGVHEGMLRVQEADLSLRLLLQVRNKVISAYTEIMRMQF